MSGFQKIARALTDRPLYALKNLLVATSALGTVFAAAPAFASGKPIPRKVLEQVMREADASGNEGLSRKEKALKDAFLKAIKEEGLEPYQDKKDGLRYIQANMPNNGFVVVRVEDDNQGITQASKDQYIEYVSYDENGNKVITKIMNNSERVSVQGKPLMEQGAGMMMILRGDDAKKVFKSLPPNGVLVLRYNGDMTDVERASTTQAAIDMLNSNVSAARKAAGSMVGLRGAMEQFVKYGVQPNVKASSQASRSSKAMAKTPQQIYEKLFGNDFQSNDVLPIASKSPMRVTVDGGVIHGKAFHNNESWTDVYVYPNGEVQNHTFKTDGASVATIIQANGDIIMIHQKADEKGMIHAFTDEIKHGSNRVQSTYVMYDKDNKEVKRVQIKTMQPKRMIKLLSQEALDNGKIVTERAGGAGRKITFPVLAR